MLRAARFAAKLNFEVAAESAEPIATLGSHLRDVPPARLYDETLKLFQSGHALRSLETLLQFDLLQYLLPHTAKALRSDGQDQTLAFLRAGLANTDRRIREERPVTPMFLFAVLLWHPIQTRAAQMREQGKLSEIESLLKACDTVVSELQSHTAYPRRFSVPMKDIIVMQRRFQNRRGARSLRLLTHKRFRAAYDLLLLRAQIGEVEKKLADWWTEVQTMSATEQRKIFEVRCRSPRRRPASTRPNIDSAV